MAATTRPARKGERIVPDHAGPRQTDPQGRDRLRGPPLMEVPERPASRIGGTHGEAVLRRGGRSVSQGRIAGRRLAIEPCQGDAPIGPGDMDQRYERGDEEEAQDAQTDLAPDRREIEPQPRPGQHEEDQSDPDPPPETGQACSQRAAARARATSRSSRAETVVGPSALVLFSVPITPTVPPHAAGVAPGTTRTGLPSEDGSMVGRAGRRVKSARRVPGRAGQLCAWMKLRTCG